MILHDVAARLRVIRYLQSLPQVDDGGSKRVQVIACDVPQRLRFLPPAPTVDEGSAG